MKDKGELHNLETNIKLSFVLAPTGASLWCAIIDLPVCQFSFSPLILSMILLMTSWGHLADILETS